MFTFSISLIEFKLKEDLVTYHVRNRQMGESFLTMALSGRVKNRLETFCKMYNCEPDVIKMTPEIFSIWTNEFGLFL